MRGRFSNRWIRERSTRRSGVSRRAAPRRWRCPCCIPTPSRPRGGIGRAAARAVPLRRAVEPGQPGGPGVRAHRDDGAERRVDAAGRELPRPDRGGQAGGLQAAPVPLRRGHGLAGGVARAAARPRRLGPAAGVAAAGRIARDLDVEHAISFDMGGTTTDVCLIFGGEAQISSDRTLGGRPLRQPMVAVESIGAGGGSIARLDHGALVVGPESAGADPGPACYARGGSRPTVSDANLVLGYMAPDRIIGGDIRVDPAAARTAVAPLASAMGMSVEAAALGVVRVANSTMLRALRRVTVERGVDGRQCHAPRLRRRRSHARGRSGSRLFHCQGGRSRPFQRVLRPRMRQRADELCAAAHPAHGGG